MLRYKTETRPRLVALYDIRPGNGAGLFSEPAQGSSSGGTKFMYNLGIYTNESKIIWKITLK